MPDNETDTKIPESQPLFLANHSEKRCCRYRYHFDTSFDTAFLENTSLVIIGVSVRWLKRDKTMPDDETDTKVSESQILFLS